MLTRLSFLLNRLRERLWIKPAIACVLSVAGVLLAHAVDDVPVPWHVPEIAQGSITELLKIIAASMLGVATFAVASMVAALASTGQTATARAFPLIVADDVSQNALSIFVAAFIFAIVALSATSNDYYGRAGRFTLFVLTLAVLTLVVLVFVRWVDRIARLGRLGTVIATVERTTQQALARRKEHPYLGGLAATGPAQGLALYSDRTGFLQRVDMVALQRIAGENGLRISLAVLPGAMIVPTRPLAYVMPDGEHSGVIDPAVLRAAFTLGPARQFDDDPRFGLVVLGEIACRALSPGINDAGTAIGILNTVHRVFAAWAATTAPPTPRYDRLVAPPLAVDDMLDDIIPPIARDGAALVEVAERVQRVLGELARCGDSQLRAAASRQAALALARAEQALHFPADRARVQRRHADYWPGELAPLSAALRD